MKKLALFLGIVFAITAHAAGYLQQQDFKTVSECISSGATAATCLLLDSQVYVSAKGLDETLAQAITNGDIGGGGTWGSITGTLSSQTDLQNALNLKADLSSPTFTGTVTAPTLVGALTGNASTATALASAPTQCTGSQFSQGIDSSGNASCATPSGGGGGGTPGGSSSDVQYNSSGSFAGNSSFTYDGSGNVTATTFIGALTGHASLDLKASNNLSDVASQQTALNNLIGGVTSGDYVRCNGSNCGLSSIQAADVPTLNQNTTGTASNLSGIEAIPSPGPSGAYMMGTGAGFVMASPLPNPSPSGAVLQSNGSAWVATNSITTSVVGPTTPYTLTIGGSTTAPTPGTNTTLATWSQSADKMFINYQFNQTTAGSAGSGTYLFPIPSGYTIDTTKITADPTGKSGTVGAASGFISGSPSYVMSGSVFVYDSTHLAIIGNINNSTPGVSAPGLIGPSTLSLSNAIMGFGFQAVVPITQFAGSAAAQTVATSPANAGYQSSLTGTISTSMSDPTSITGSISAQGTTQNISCSAASGALGVTCTGSGISSGSNYEVCAYGYASASVAANQAIVQLTDGSNSVIVPSVYIGSPSASVPGAYSLCGNYTASSSSITFKVMGASQSSSGSLAAVSFTIKSLSTPVNAVTLTGGVSTNASGNWRNEGSNVPSSCTSSPCTLGTNGVLCSSITRSSAGIYSCTYASSFSGPPAYCGASAYGNAAATNCFVNGAPTSTSVGIACLNTETSVGTDDNFSVFCQGPR